MMANWFVVFLVVVGVITLPFIISHYLAKSLRVPESATGLGTIFLSILGAGLIIFAALQPDKPRSHEVIEGETIQSIAEKYDISLTEIANLNNIQTPDDLKPGNVLEIPNPNRLEIKRGVDLSGGVILIYEVDEELSRENSGNDDGEGVDIDALVEALAKRINPGGVKEIVIRPYGDKQVEIIIPDVDAAEVERLKRQITKAGFLRFLIVAKRSEHERLFALADAMPNARVIKNGSETLGEWITVGTTEDGGLKVGDFSQNNGIRQGARGAVEVLMYHDRYRVEGKHIRSVTKGYKDLAPAVNFTMRNEGAKLFGGLTSTNVSSRLGIVMDNALISAPNLHEKISTQGQISGRFTDEEVENLISVLRAGRLPAVLKPDPITENQIDPLLGADTISKGKFAITTSIVAVLAFMCIYYRFAGLVACFALVLNLMLIMAIMILIRGAFTLPGLAGLVLTVGMSVDANVLIFERIREELKRGSALRLAIRNGFSRATSTIVDANLTTLITAIVLYLFGKDQLRGFAVTLILGIVMSMFTAIYCSRVIFDVAERRRWIKKLTMTQLLDSPKLNLVGLRGIAAIASLLLIGAGIVAVASRGAKMFDIDFLGGTSVQARLKAPMEYDQVWERLTNGEEAISDDVSLTQVRSDTSQANTLWKIDTSLEDNRELQDRLTQRFTDNDGTSLFVSHTVDFDPPKVVEKEAPTTTESSATPNFGALPPSDADNSAGNLSAQPSGDVVTSEPGEETSTSTTEAETNPESVAPIDGTTGPAEEAAPVTVAPDTEVPSGQESVPQDVDSTLEKAVDGAAEVIEEVVPDGARADLPSYSLLAQADITTPSGDEATTTESTGATDVQSTTTIRFGQRVTRDTMIESFQEAAANAGVSDPPIDLTGPNGEADSAAGFKEWKIVANTNPQQLNTILQSMKSGLESEPAWRSSSKVGGQVAGDTQQQAITAILISLVCIVAYLWIRFQRVIFGLSAVVALVHDVLITLGAIGISLYLSQALGFLMIDEFKISLSVVAAFLTIIGYSLNDTIVVFDRIREVRGRSPDITEEMINTSINQTLSRTLLTSLTTLIVVLILYIFGGQGIHSFAFALLVGVLVGTYSSIFVASPALLWMSKMQDTAGDSSANAKKEKATA